MSLENNVYNQYIKKIDNLIEKGSYKLAKEKLQFLYEFKPVRLNWFVQNAKLLWHTKGYEAAKEALKSKYVLNYCYDGLQEALQLLIDIESKENNKLEAERVKCSLDLISNISDKDNLYNKYCLQLENVCKNILKTYYIEDIKICYDLAYKISDVIGLLIFKEYLNSQGENTYKCSWISDLYNIKYIEDRISENSGSFIIIEDEDRFWQCRIFAKILNELNKKVYVLKTPRLYDNSEQFDESARYSIKNLINEDGINFIQSYYIQSNNKILDNRYLIISELIKGDKLFTVLGCGYLMDDIAILGDMKKHFERFNFMMGDIFETNFSAGWVGDYRKYIGKIYNIDAEKYICKKPELKYSIVIPARNSATTLRYTINTCLKQDFPCNDYEIVISDNSVDSNDEVYRLCQELNDSRINYIKTPCSLPLAKSFEFAFLNTRGEFIIPIGSDDGLLPWALKELEKVRLLWPDENIIQWERGFYAWPGFNGEQENQFIVPCDYKNIPNKYLYRDRDTYINMLKNDMMNVYVLPMLYINSGFKRDYMKVLLQKTGRMWDGNSQDVYISIVNILINSRILNLKYPLSIAGMSSSSVGRISSSNRGDNDVSRDIIKVSKGTEYSVATPSMLERLSPTGVTYCAQEVSLVMSSLYRCVTRGIVDINFIDDSFDKKDIFSRAVKGNLQTNDQFDMDIHSIMYTASLHGLDFLQWFDKELFYPAMQPMKYTMSSVKYKEGYTEQGGQVLDASRFDVDNIDQAVDLFIKTSGLN